MQDWDGVDDAVHGFGVVFCCGELVGALVGGGVGWWTSSCIAVDGVGGGFGVGEGWARHGEFLSGEVFGWRGFWVERLGWRGLRDGRRF